MEELGLQKGVILTLDKEERIEFSGKVIDVKPVYKWLLE
jgi:predicted AAA+ superfamily ATPase